MSSMNVARALVALALVVLAWWAGSVIDGWGAALVAILPPMVLAERLLYVAWKEVRS